MRTVAIVNQKGGCGKTTTAINLAGVLARLGQRTLLIDLDPQSHCAVGLGVPEEKIDLQIGDALLVGPGQRLDESRLLWKISKNLDLAPSSMRLAALEAARGGLAEAEERDRRLSMFLERLGDRYDWRLIDCPPSIGLLTFNALRAADEVIIPVETSFFAMKGAERQVKTIRSLARRLGGQTPYRLLPTMHDPESGLAKELLAKLATQFDDRLLPVVIRLDRKLKEATTFGQPLIEYDAESPGAADHIALARHLMANPASKLKARPVDDEPEEPAFERPLELDQPEGDGQQVMEAKPLGSESQPTGYGAPTTPPPAPAPTSRAAELAMRTQQMMARVAEIQARVEAERAAATAVERPGETVLERSGPLTLVADEQSPARPADPSVARLYGVRETGRGALFVQPAAPGRRVCIAGAFNRWTPELTPMAYNERLGVYEACVDLPMGRNEYRVVVDGVWMADPHNRNTTINPFGELNSVVVVTRRRSEPALYEGAD